MTTPTIVYIAGPMTGLPDYNYPAFNAAAYHLRNNGYVVINPAEQFDGRTDLPREVYMRRAVHSLLQADVVVTLRGFANSAGASLEVSVADELGVPRFTMAEFIERGLTGETAR